MFSSFRCSFCVFLILLHTTVIVDLTKFLFQKGVISRVADGDTVTFVPDDKSEDEWKIRLAEIDAPESDQPGGKESTQFLKVGHNNFFSSNLLYCISSDENSSLNEAKKIEVAIFLSIFCNLFFTTYFYLCSIHNIIG